MIVELGHFALILAFLVAVVQMVVPMVGASKGWTDWMGVAIPAAGAQFLLTAFAFLALMHAFVVSDFSVRLVAENSHSLKPMIYKIAGTWGNHEGSMMLWMLILTLFGAMVAWGGSNLPPALRARVLSVQAGIAVAFFAFILWTSNPFIRLANPPIDGNDLNPLLQDPGLAFHPPFLYLGYVGLSMAYSFAIAALIEGRVDAAWARWVRPWTLLAWVFLTIGIAFGSIWAYYELGWGGWWFWDPVENVSFMPWLISCALLHSAIVVEKRDTLKSWTILLAILAFSFSMVGAFVVRSGVITSVHAFANDPDRGVFLLLILGAFTGGSLMLYAWRAAELRSSAVFGMVSRESGIVFNNVLLVVATLVVFFGTLWPLIAEVTSGRKISVGPPFFDLAFTPFMVAVAVILPIFAMLPWKRGRLGRAARSLRVPGILALALGALAWQLQTGRSMLAPIGIALSVWLVLGAFTDLALRARAGEAALSETARRLRGLPRADWGKALAHAGLGLSILGIACITAWASEDIRVARLGESWPVGAYTLRLDKVEAAEGPNYQTETATVAVFRGARQIATLHPQKRFYPVQRMPTTEAAIDRGLTRDLYVALGDAQKDGGWAVRTYVKPMANWIWIGAMVMALGGIVSLTDRRYRVGAPAPRAPRGAVAAE
ncbi:heme lyase CcmF/NrfE family subunit [Amaricoccus solimangrovi]|uniref:Heme lyase CcmF/NrfE family subunit n=1 Tax=Amaricoccus solimangrovi TaxID=2589815 RepID=A0A501WIX0_9RHOB|nr:heme lyase CcmF/NrfE family subunit [Amaricoccus solimangrovi]TPE49439.1 heme lyase CcmF/NrfE family subunit [Amaricoccus solimangrovi]